MTADLKTAIRAALAGSSSQRTVDVSVLYKLGTEASVQSALLEMYRAREVYCCLHTKRGTPSSQPSPGGGRGKRENPSMIETSVWWAVGGVSAPHSTGRVGIRIGCGT